MGFLKRLFGEGVIRFEGVTADGTKFTAKVGYEGSLDTLDKHEMEEYVKNRVFVETGKQIKTVKIVGMY